ncbi:MAG: glucose-1-phosphate adenylyltransferase subunit GlgD [Oscillospiraceae bacterium]|nr:glucose-1-phosphate adenylyltransferase subunit GlgD [Oscillospiraceae bacterium]MCL2125849.1 glucose-1-phosphate adenylyltransferase subunit GlgD [Oscillospiraceae bacterium]
MYTGLCLSDPHPDRAGDGSKLRTLSAARFAGRYRLVDFMLSNMVNSKIFTIGMVLNSHYQSLIGHIGMGKEWDLARKSGGVTFFPPYLADERQSVNSELDGPLQRAAQFIMEAKDEYIVLADSSVVYNMDYRTAIEAHRKNEADITAIYTKRAISPGERENAVILDIADDGRIYGINRAPYTNEKLNVSLGAYVMRKGFFIQLTANEKNCGMLRFSRILLADALERMNVMGFEFCGYTAHISSVETFFQYNMEMLDAEKRNALFDVEGRHIFTNRRDTLPTKYGKDADIRNSIIADGCQIDGTVIDSIICRNVRIKPGAIVKNCILQDDTVVERGAMLDYIIADRSVSVSEHRSMIGSNTYPVYIERARVI